MGYERPTSLDEPDPLRLVDRQRPQDQPLHDADNEGIDADAKRNCEDDSCRKQWGTSDHSNGDARIAAEVLDPARSPGVPMFLLYLVESADIKPCLARCSRASQPCGEVSIDLQVKVMPKFVVYLTFDHAAPEDRSQSVQHVLDRRDLPQARPFVRLNDVLLFRFDTTLADLLSKRKGIELLRGAYQ